MLQNVMQGKRDSIIDGSVGPVSELVRVQLMINGCLEGLENQALEHFHDHGGQSDWLIIVEACYARLLKNGRYGGVKHRGTWHCSSDLVNRAAVANWRRQLMTSGRGGAVGEDRPWELEEARRDDEGAPQILKMSVI